MELYSGQAKETRGLKSNLDPITKSGELVDIVTSKKPGDVITLSVYRDREEMEIKVVIGEQIQSAELSFEEEETQPYDPYAYGYGFGGNPFGFGFGDYNG